MNTLSASAAQQVLSAPSHPHTFRAQQYTKALLLSVLPTWPGFSIWEGWPWISPVNPESLTKFTKNNWHKLEYLKGANPGRQVSFSYDLQWLLSGAWTRQARTEGQKSFLGSPSLTRLQHKRYLGKAAVFLKRFIAVGHPSWQATPHVQ